MTTRRDFIKVAGAGAFAVWASAGAAGYAAQAGKPTQLFEDLGFRRGFLVLPPDKHSRDHSRQVMAPAPAQAEPVWTLAQWYSHFTLAGAAPHKLETGGIRFADGGKAVTFERPDAHGHTLLMELRGSAEYGERLHAKPMPWPHLLAKQKLAVKLASLKRLPFHLECRLMSVKENHKERWTKPQVAQFIAVLIVKDCNPDSPGNGDYIWFCIPVYDSRYRITRPCLKLDTFCNKFIYSPGGEEYTGSRSLHDGEWVTIDRDLLPLVHQGLEAAWQRGHLKQSRAIENFQLIQFSVGWELPGNLDVVMAMRNLSLAGEMV